MYQFNEYISLVKYEMLRRFPNCSHTINILLWDDDTFSVECRHGDDKKIYLCRYYDNKLTYEEIDVDGKVMVKDKYGKEHLKYLSDTKPKLF